MSNNIILLVFEGEKTEPQIFESIKRLFFSSSKNTILCAIYMTDIYQLWYDIQDDVENLDLIEVLREKNNTLLSGVERKHISEIYLFFDHDAHARKNIKNSNNTIQKMLSLFDNETENGKLYISYPMVEALKDCNMDETFCIDRCCLDIYQNTKYKELIDKRSLFRHITKYTKDIWFLIIKSNLKKANCIVNDIFELPDYSVIRSLNQISIFDNQMKKFISQTGKVAIISCFPLFIIT